MSGFLPPVVFEIQAKATEALATFAKVDAGLKKLEGDAIATGMAMGKLQKSMVIVNATAKATGLIFAGVAAIGIKELTDLEKSYASLGQTMSNVGVSTDANRKKAEELSGAFVDLGFDGAQTASALQILVQATGDFNKSAKMMTLAADVARVKNMSLEESAAILAKATQGNAKAFKVFGISLDATKPKAEAIQEAFDKLTQKTAGQAEAFTKTFRGQILVLTEQFKDLTEVIGAYALPVLNKFLSSIRTVAVFLSKHKEILIAVATILTTVVAVAVVNLTKKLYAQAVAWAAANWEITLTIAAVAALVAGFVWAWNKFEGLRKAIVWVLQGFIDLFRLITVGIQYLIKGLALIPDWAGGNQKAFKNADKTMDGFIKKIDTVYDKVGMLSKNTIKIDMKGISIPDFGNGTGTGTGTTTATQISDALLSAKQKIKDASDAIKQAFADIKSSFMEVVGFDWRQSVEDNLLNPTEKIVKKAQEAANAYAESSSQYKSALKEQEKAAARLLVAIKSNDKAAILSAESAYKASTDLVNNLEKNMQSSIDSLHQFQQDAVQAIVDYTNEITTLNADADTAKAKALADQLALEKQYNIDVAALRKENALAVVQATQEVEKRRAEILKASEDQLRNIFRNATQANIGDLFNNLTFQGRWAAGGNVTALTAGLKDELTKATTLAEDASALAGKGFSQTFIEQVVAQGPDMGHQLAQSILSASPDSIAELKKYWDALEKVSQSGVDVLATTLNAGMNLATRDLMEQLAQVNIDFNNTLANLAQDLADSLVEKQDTYDAATAAIKAALDAELKVIDDKIKATKERIQQLRDALIALGGLGAPGTQHGAPNLNPLPETAPEVTQTASEAIAAIDSILAEAKTLSLETIGVATNLDQLTTYVENASNLGNSATDVANAMADALLSSPAMTEQLGGVSGALSSARYTGMALAAQAQQQAAATTTNNSTTNVTVNATTTADPTTIASEVGWAIRTSGDMTYAQAPSGKWLPLR